MANPTTNFGWVMPTSASLVTNLPADFNVFGQAVDTSMQYLLGGTTGQILSKTSGTNMAFTWINNDQGDITGVTAGTGISVTSPTGPVPTVAIDTAVTVDKTTAQTLTNKTLTSPALTTPTISTATTNGDILYGTGSGALARLGIGSTSQVLTVASGIPTWATPASTPTFAGCAAIANSVSLAVNAGTQYQLTFPTEDFDSNNFHSTTTNTGRITIPTGYGGKYLLNITMLSGFTYTYAYLYYVKNGTTTGLPTGGPGAFFARINNANAEASLLVGSMTVSLAAGDYIEVGWQSSVTGTMVYDARFSATYLGA